MLADYQQFFGENETPKPAGIAVLTDSDDTKSTAEGDYATFRICRKYNPGGRWSSPARAAVLSMCAFAVMGLVISLRLKAELRGVPGEGSCAARAGAGGRVHGAREVRG